MKIKFALNFPFEVTSHQKHFQYPSKLYFQLFSHNLKKKLRTWKYVGVKVSLLGINFHLDKISWKELKLNREMKEFCTG